MSGVDAVANYVTTSDGVRLHYLEAGSGQTIVLVPGWSQTAEQYKYQIHGLSSRYHVIALDQRGHGESDKPNSGYKIQRLAAAPQLQCSRHHATSQRQPSRAFFDASTARMLPIVSASSCSSRSSRT